jgi:hypothetical protein
MSTNPLRCTMDNDICTVFNGANQVASGTKGVVNNQWNFMFMRNLKRECFTQDIIFLSEIDNDLPRLIQELGRDYIWDSQYFRHISPSSSHQ